MGIFLPLLPTTPFLLLSAICFSRSSDKLHIALLENKWLGKYIKNYQEGKGIPLRAKIICLTLLWPSITYSALYVVENIIVKTILFSIAFFVTIHVMSVRTYKE